MLPLVTCTCVTALQVPNPPEKVASRRKLPAVRRASRPVATTERPSAVHDTDSTHHISATEQSSSSLSTSADDNENQTSQKPISPVKLRLRQKIRQLQSRRWKMARKMKSLQSLLTSKSSQCKTLEDSIASVLNAAEGFLTPMQLSFFRAQLHRQNRKYRWSTKDKLFALQLRYKSSISICFTALQITFVVNIAQICCRSSWSY